MLSTLSIQKHSMYFFKTEEDFDDLYKHLNKFNMSGDDLLNIYSFCQEVDYEFFTNAC